MTAPLDEDVVQRINDLGTISWSGITFRHTTSGRDALSGTGARLNGGRWNPAGVCSTIYLAQPLGTVLLEFDRVADANNLEPIAMLRSRREIHTIVATDLKVVDLRTEEALAFVGLTIEDVRDDDWTACQSVGHAAYFLEAQAVVAPSATGMGLVIAAFEGRIKPGQLVVEVTEAFDEAAYRRISAANLSLVDDR